MDKRTFYKEESIIALCYDNFSVIIWESKEAHQNEIILQNQVVYCGLQFTWYVNINVYLYRIILSYQDDQCTYCISYENSFLG